MPVRIEPAGLADLRKVLGPARPVLAGQALADHPRYWGERDLRSLHLTALVQEFGPTCLVARAGDGIRGYVFGFVTPAGTGCMHLAAICRSYQTMV
jgi:hypothetical protein